MTEGAFYLLALLTLIVALIREAVLVTRLEKRVQLTKEQVDALAEEWRATHPQDADAVRPER